MVFSHKSVGYDSSTVLSTPSIGFVLSATPMLMLSVADDDLSC